MPVQVSPKRQVKGLYSNFHRSAGIPDGGVLEADNCTPDRPGLLSKRKGFNRYGSELDNLADSFMDYNGSLVVHSGSNISCDAQGDGTLTSWGNIYESPGIPHTIRGINLKKNFYFTSRDGIYRNDSLTSTPVLSGMPEGLDIQIEKFGTGDGWFAQDTQVSYRVTWSREDANEGLIIGEPSYRRLVLNMKKAVSITHDGEGHAVVAHTDHGFIKGDIITISDSSDSLYDGPGKDITVIDEDSYRFEFVSEDAGDSLAAAGKDYDLNLTFTVPDGIVSGDKYEIHRTALSASGTTDPGDDHMSVLEKEITAAEITAGVVVHSDTIFDISLGEFLYTNSGQETVSQRNTRPPQCKDMVEYKGHMFLSDITRKAEKEIHLSEIEDIAAEDSISIKVRGLTITYKFSDEERVEEREFKLQTTDELTQDNIETTMRSLVRVINREDNNDLFSAHYSSGSADAAGKVLFRTKSPAFGGISIIVNSSTVGESFKEVIPTSGESFSSDDNTIANGLAYSKVLEPDAVPDANILQVGNRHEPIQRIFALKSSLIILKKDGAFRLSGNTPSTFILMPLDLSVSFKFPNAAVALNDAIYCLSTQGILKVGENGTTVVSYPIEDRIKNIASYSGCARIAFAVASEENRRVIIFTQKDSGDSVATIGWVYNFLTKEWTTWSKPARCGATLRGERDLYLGHAVDKYILKERNGISRRNSGDYMDEDISVEITGSPTTTVVFTYDYREPIRAGFLLSQGGSSSNIKSITSVVGTTVTAVLESAISGISAGAATVSLPIDSFVKWGPNNLGASEIPKQFTYAMITMESGTTLTNELGFYSDAVPVAEWVGPIVLGTPLGWGRAAWGTSPWGNAESVAVVPLVSPVPRQHQRCRELTLMFRHRVANEEFDIESTGFRVKTYRGKLVRIPE